MELSYCIQGWTRFPCNICIWVKLNQLQSKIIGDQTDEHDTSANVSILLDMMLAIECSISTRLETSFWRTSQRWDLKRLLLIVSCAACSSILAIFSGSPRSAETSIVSAECPGLDLRISKETMMTGILTDRVGYNFENPFTSSPTFGSC